MVGETGSGKSTQLPKICLDMGRGKRRFIGHTQPRRIAARSIAARIAEELGVEPGGAVGYKTRFNDRVSRDSYIKVMTDGILLAELESDRKLNRYDTLIVDEAHERSINIDFLLGYLQRLLKRRRDLKIVITSATIDPSSFSKFFSGAPVIEITGKSFPVEVRYRQADRAEDRPDASLASDVVDAVRNLESDTRGDILVFLPGEKEIGTTAKLLGRLRLPRTECVPLYARLSVEDQQKIFKPHEGRRIVLATNVAETSLTVPGIHYVIDTGLARISRYRPGRQIQSLPIEPISRAAADQRKGRCGRTAAGVCIRLYSQGDFDSRPSFTVPEILRTSLASVILKLKSLGLGDIENFPLMDPPAARMIKDGYRLLEELGAVTGAYKLSRSGRRLAKIPVDPRLGRMLLESDRLHCAREVLVVCAALSVQDPRLFPEHAKDEARECHARWQDPGSDFISIINLWNGYRSETGHLSRRQRQRYCRERFLSPARMREWQDVHRQLGELCNKFGFSINRESATYKRLHRALLSGLLGNIAQKQDGREYLGTRGKTLFIHPASAGRKKLPGWIVCAELVDTTRLYARTIAKIEPQWIESAASGLTKTSYSEPRWVERRGQVVATERVTLYGLVLIPGRDVNYGPVNPVESRKIFIAEALAMNRLGSEFKFQGHNTELISEIEQLEHRSRRKDIMIDESTLYDHFDRLIPGGVYDMKSFSSWYGKATNHDPSLLCLQRETLMRRTAEHVTVERFPRFLEIDGNTLQYRYHFEPGHPSDGVTVEVPSGLLPRLDSDSFSWLVPGLLLEKIIALIKGLPKTLRKNFIPVNEYAESSLHHLDRAHGSLTDSLARALEHMAGVRIDEKDWDESALPDHLRINFEVLGPDGGIVAHGRSIESLLSDLAQRPQFKAVQATSDPRYDRAGIRTWDFGDLPETVAFHRDGISITVYPALVDEKNSVAIRAFDSPLKAHRAHKAGLRRLLVLQLPDHERQLRKKLPNMDRMCINYSNIGSCESLRRDLVDTALDEVLFGGCKPVEIRSEESFRLKVDYARSALIPASNELCHLAAQSLELYRACLHGLDDCETETAGDIKRQLRGLIYKGFVSKTPPKNLKHLPRYLEGVKVRIGRAKLSPEKDARCMQMVFPYEERLANFDDNSYGVDDPALMEFRWLLEEYRISLFAQELRTAVPVSAKRLDKKWDQVDQARNG